MSENDFYLLGPQIEDLNIEMYKNFIPRVPRDINTGF